MFVGHLGAGLAAKRLAPEVRLGVLFLATMGLDALLWIFVLLGLESVHFPASVGEARYPTFTFPYSHGLVASLAWSAIAFALVRVAGRSLGAAPGGRRRRCSPTSSWMSSVHVAGLAAPGGRVLPPGPRSLASHRPRARRRVRARWLGWWLYCGARDSARGARRWGLGARLVAVSALLTIWGALATGPASARPRRWRVVSLLTIGVLTVLARWLDRRARARWVERGPDPPHPREIVRGRPRKVSSAACETAPEKMRVQRAGDASSSSRRSARTTARARARWRWSGWTPGPSAGCAARRGTPTRPASSARRWARYAERIHHPDRLLHPLRRVGPKGSGTVRADLVGGGARPGRGGVRREGGPPRIRDGVAVLLRGHDGAGPARRHQPPAPRHAATPAGTRRSASRCPTPAGSRALAPSAEWTSARWASTRTSS